MIKPLWRYPHNCKFPADQNSTSPKVQGLISRVRLLKMFPLFEVLFITTKRVCLQNIELKYCPYSEKPGIVFLLCRMYRPFRAEVVWNTAHIFPHQTRKENIFPEEPVHCKALS